MSPESDGVDLVPLFACTPEAVSSRVSPEVPYLSRCVPSSSSRTGSPSHHARKLVEPGLRPMLWPVALRRLPSAADHDSAPGEPAQMSSETPRPLSPLAGVDHSTCPVRASAIQELGFELSSSTLNTSSPGRDGTRSPTCSASPWPLPVFHRGPPLSSMHMAPKTIS